MRNVRVVVAAGRTLFRQGLIAIIGSEAGFEIAGDAADPDEARRVCERAVPDLVVLDCELANYADRSLLACLRASCPRAAIIALGEADGPECGQQARLLAEGAAAYVDSGVDRSELLRVLRITAARCCPEENPDAFGPPAAQTLAGGPHHKHTITERETMVIALIAQGLCNKEVAHRLGIGTQTVKNHVSHLLEKLALADRTQLAIYALEHHFEF